MTVPLGSRKNTSPRLRTSAATQSACRECVPTTDADSLGQSAMRSACPCRMPSMLGVGQTTNGWPSRTIGERQWTSSRLLQCLQRHDPQQLVIRVPLHLVSVALAPPSTAAGWPIVSPRSTRNFSFDEGTSVFRSNTCCRFAVSGSNDKTVGRPPVGAGVIRPDVDAEPCSVEGTCAPARGSAGKLPPMRPLLALGHPVSSRTTPTAGFGASWARCEPDSEGRRPAQCSTLWPPAHQKHRSLCLQ